MMPNREEPLTFFWPGHGNVSLALPGFILISLLVHLAAFYLFRIVYPTPASILAPPATITLVTPQTEGSRAFLRWLSSKDLAELSSTREIMPASLLEVPFLPAYANSDARPLSVEEHTEALRYPPVRNPLSLDRKTNPNAISVKKIVPGRATAVIFSEQLQSRAPEANSLPPMKIKGGTSMTPTRFLISVNERGKILHVFLQSSSTDSQVDLEAESYLAELSFKPSKKTLTWGTATFHWGIDSLGVRKNPSKP